MCLDDGCSDGGVSSFPVSFPVHHEELFFSSCKRVGNFLAVYLERGRAISCFNRGKSFLISKVTLAEECILSSSCGLASCFVVDGGLGFRIWL